MTFGGWRRILSAEEKGNNEGLEMWAPEPRGFWLVGQFQPGAMATSSRHAMFRKALYSNRWFASECVGRYTENGMAVQFIHLMDLKLRV